jgi:hypothetical protein
MPGRQALAALRERFRGRVVLPGDPAEDPARITWGRRALDPADVLRRDQHIRP